MFCAAVVAVGTLLLARLMRLGGTFLGVRDEVVGVVVGRVVEEREGGSVGQE